MFDISKIAVSETTTIHVKDAAGEPLYADAERKLPVQIIIWGPGSDAYGVVESRQTARALKRLNENDGKVTAPTLEERRAEAAEDLAAITVKFVNFNYPPAGEAQGAPLFEAVYADKALGFIAKQVQKTVSDWSAFSKGSHPS